MRRKSSVPEIHTNGHRSSVITHQTVHREGTRMDTNGGEKVLSPHSITQGNHSCTQCGIDFPSHDSLQKHEFLDHSNDWGHDSDDMDELKDTENHHHTTAADSNGRQVTSQPKNNSPITSNLHAKDFREQIKKDISIFTCQLCGAAFFDQSSLSHHTDMHAGTTKAIAPTPVIKTESATNNVSQYVKQTITECKYCGEGFMSQTALAQHERAHELVTKDVARNQQLYKCRHCEEKFDRFCDMMQHERTHVGEDTFQWQLDAHDDGVKRSRGRPPKVLKKPWQMYAEIDQYLSDTIRPSSPGSPRRGRRPKVRKYTKHNRPGSHIKRAKTAYFYFLEEFRKQYRTEAGWNCKASEITKACGQKWNSMKDKERRPYVDSASIDRQRYESEISVYKKERDPEKPKKPPTAFFFFLTDFRAQMAGQKIETGRRLTEICGEQWNKLTEEQKAPYMNIYAAEVKKYQDAMEEYKSRKARPSDHIGVVGAEWRGPGRPTNMASYEIPPMQIPMPMTGM